MTKRRRAPTVPAGIDLGATAADLDAAKRLHDAVNLHLVADFEQAIRSVIVVKLADGSSDGSLYASWNEACAKGAPDPRWYAPFRITPDGITLRDARLWLRAMRNLGGNARMIPTGPEGLVSPLIFPAGGRKLRP